MTISLRVPLYAGERGEPDELRALMKDVVDYREEKQPVKARTGGSTFQEPRWS